jgi:uncharacterized membrane protein YgcG
MRTARHVALITTLLVLFAPASAFAANVPRLAGAVTDSADVLDGRVDEVEVAITDLLKQQDVQLFVLFVDTTGDLTATEFVDETARVNSLGANDALLLVAVDDRTDAIWVSDALPITDTELDGIIADTLEPALRDGDFAGAAIASAEAIGKAAVAAGEPPKPAATEAPQQGGATTHDINIGVILGLTLLGIGLVLLAVWALSRLPTWREAEERNRQTGKLAREANRLLIAIDERTRTADQEAGFVEAEFGDSEAAPFRAALADAREELRAAFGLRQRLDDAEPEDPPTREAMLKEIIERCQRAGSALDRQAAHIGELRQLERDAPAILESLPAQVEAQEQRVPAAEATLASLASYAASTVSPVKGNVAEARKGLTGARTAIARGVEALERGGPGTGGDRRTAAREIGIAQDGIAGASALLDAVDKLAAAVREADAHLADELQAAQADLAAAREAQADLAAAGTAVPAGNGAAVPISSAYLVSDPQGLAAAEDAVRSASAAAATVPLDPAAAYRLAVSARRGAGDVLAAVRRDAAQRAQLAAALEASLTSARADVDQAGDFIATRRGGVGRRARTRLAEAERTLEAALNLRESDATAAMENARRAHKLADEAYSLAVLDFARWDRGGPSPASGGSDLAGAILGGIIGGILSGGGRGGGWGGSQWGSPGSSGGGGGMGGGGWGGGGHSIGGGFGGGGGGGGHSQGGRW